MFDESVDVSHAMEVKSSNSNSDQDEIVEIMGKGKSQSRAEKRVDKYISDSDSPEPERFINDLPMQKKSPDKPQNITHMSNKRPQPSRQTSKEQSGTKQKLTDSSDNSDSDDDLDEIGVGAGRARGRTAMVMPTDGAYDPQQYADLDVGPEMNEIFQHILRYAPQKIDIDFKLKPFLPDYIPAVGDIDAFIKVVTPEYNLQGEKLPPKTLDKMAELGLVVLDEPASDQSDPALLHLQLRAASKSNTDKQSMVVKKIENADKSNKAIERWIKDVSELHQSKPPPNVHYTKSMPDIDTLMGAWPEKMENKLTQVGFPPAFLDCSLSQYVDVVCGIFNIPVHPELGLNGKIQALHVLFTLYDAVKNEQLYKEKHQDSE